MRAAWLLAAPSQPYVNALLLRECPAWCRHRLEVWKYDRAAIHKASRHGRPPRRGNGCVQRDPYLTMQVAKEEKLVRPIVGLEQSFQVENRRHVFLVRFLTRNVWTGNV
eukprot:scaffold106646_cov31-Tisochrysis_lutea.AAC.6